jgi:hypothetical protein
MTDDSIGWFRRAQRVDYGTGSWPWYTEIRIIASCSTVPIAKCAYIPQGNQIILGFQGAHTYWPGVQGWRPIGAARRAGDYFSTEQHHADK